MSPQEQEVFMVVFMDPEQTPHIMLEHYQVSILGQATAGLEHCSLPMAFILQLLPTLIMTPTVFIQVLQDSIKIIYMQVYRGEKIKYIQPSLIDQYIEYIINHQSIEYLQMGL